MADTVADHLAALDQALRDPSVRAVIASRGGCGSLRLLPGVDRQALRADPKPLVGYCGSTALNQLLRRCGPPPSMPISSAPDK